MGGVATSPFVGRIVDRMEPWYAILISSCVCVAVYAVQTAAAGLSVAVVIIVCFGMDVFRQTQQVSIATRVLGLDPLARARMNAVLILAVRCQATPW
jgi:predicted MFS family arabinose efflux permease